MYKNRREKVSELKEDANRLRNLVFENCISTNTGHLASAFSCAEILTTLYYGDVLKYNPENPEWDDRDRFILSKGHASPMLYHILGDRGFYPTKWLDTSCQKEGKMGVHLQKTIPGVEISSGTLGHGLGISAGIALAAKMNLKDYYAFVLLGDGECYEGSVWESAMFAGAYKLNNLVAIIDRNGLGATDFTENGVGLEPLDKKWRYCGWDVKKVNGHSIGELLNVFEKVRARKSSKPLVVIADTIKCKGISFMENIPSSHGRLPKGEEIEKAREELRMLYSGEEE